jgi:hypothetical protein
MPHAFKLEYENLKADKLPPIWQFSGLAIILCLAFLIWNRGKTNEKNEREYLKSPQINDLYRYRTISREYSSYKVKAYTHDSITLIRNKYTAAKILKAIKIDHDTCFDDSFFTISKDQTIAWYDSGVIYHIVRKKSLDDNGRSSSIK